MWPKTRPTLQRQVSNSLSHTSDWRCILDRSISCSVNTNSWTMDDTLRSTSADSTKAPVAQWLPKEPEQEQEATYSAILANMSGTCSELMILQNELHSELLAVKEVSHARIPSSRFEFKVRRSLEAWSIFPRTWLKRAGSWQWTSETYERNMLSSKPLARIWSSKLVSEVLDWNMLHSNKGPLWITCPWDW